MKKGTLTKIKWLLEHMPKWTFPLTVVSAGMIYPRMEKIVALPFRKHIWEVFWKHGVLFAPSKKDSLLFAYPRPFKSWLRIREGDVVFEGGSAIGEDTVRIAEIVGPEGLVLAAEPDPRIVKFLKANTRNFRNVKVIEKALWKCKSSLNFQRGGTLGGHLRMGGSKENQIIKIPADSIDNITSDQKVDVIKLNVEGAELEALQGASHTLEGVREILVAAHHIRNGKYTAGGVKNILRSKGFRVQLVHGILAHHYVLAREIPP